MKWMRGVALAAAGLMGALSGVSAQTSATLSAGPAQYDLSGTGWSGTAALHVERPLGSGLRIEAGSGVFWYTTQGDNGVVMLLPEVGVTAQAPMPLPLYVGLGVGHSVVVSGEQSGEVVLYGTLGLSFPMLPGWALRPEVRLRIIDPWVGGVGGFTIGINRLLGG